MRHLAAIALVAALATTADAQPVVPPPAPPATSGLVEWLDRDAPIAVRLEAAELDRWVAFARRVGGEAGAIANLATLASLRYLGFDAFSRGGWQAAGLDPDAPVLLQIGAIDSAATDRAYRELARTGGQWGTHRDSSPALWRSRLVARTGDPDRARAMVMASDLVERALAIEPASEQAVAELLRAGTTSGLARELAGLDLTAIAAVPELGGLVFVRQRGDVIAVDLVAPFAGDAIEWRRDRAALRAVLDPPARARGLPFGGARAVSTPGLAVWSHPLGLFHMTQAWRATRRLRLGVGGGALPDLGRGCARLRSLERAALTDLAIHLRITGRTIDLDARYGHRGSLAAALATSDDGVLAGVDAADLDATIAIAGAAGLGRLPRPSLLTVGWDSMWRIATWCGAATPLIYGFAWPELAALWLDELGLAIPAARRLIAGMGNLGVAIDAAAADKRTMRGVVEVALHDRAPELAGRALDAVFGAATERTRPRAHLRWGRGPLHPYLIGGAPALAGAGFGESAAWRLARPGHASAPSGRPPALVTAGGRLDRLLPAFVDGRLAGLARALAARLGAFRLDADVSPAALELTLSIDTR